MNIRLIGRMLVATAVAGLGVLATNNAAMANPENKQFGAVTFHNPPVSARVRVMDQQLRGHPRSEMANWRAYSTYPVFSKAQRSLIQSTTQNARAAAAASSTVPYWEAPITSPLDGKTYTMSMVGASPFAATKAPTTITYVPIVLRVTIGRTVYDPTTPACDDTVAVSTRFFNSPLFQSATFTSNGQVITDQLASAFQRANFWSYVNGTGYNVRLAPSVATPIVTSVSLTGTNSSARCSNGRTISLGRVGINTFDRAIRNVIAQYSAPNQLPIVLTYNIVETQTGQCCILGYHSAVAVTGGVQTYATGAYIDSGVFSATRDISVWSHEITEWLDDPFVQAAVAGGGADDLTPAWGNIGQVSGCQNNLETGDPLSGRETSIAGANGFTYHYQDLAFYDWFYRTPAHGTGGRYSFFGTFSTTQPLCV